MISAAWRADLFCRVVDNLGDAGVCWRLARQLVQEHGCQVRLVIDDPAALQQFVAVDPADMALLDHGQIVLAPWTVTDPADLVIETFGCDVPAPYAEALAQRAPQPVWYNLEYLSAEDWVLGCHGLPSPHPRLPVSRQFFFPGFVNGTGGLLREAGLLQAVAASQAASAADLCRATLTADRQARMPPEDLQVALFCYAHPVLDQLLAAIEAGPCGVHCRVFQGPAQQQVQAWAAAHPGHRTRFTWLPWLGQAAFDQVLWDSDLNLVRGEDSFVRAQWAAKPFFWDIYPQSDDAHLVKMAAFLRLYRADLPDLAAAQALGALWQAWVRREGAALAVAWAAVCRHLPALQAKASAWQAQLGQQPDLLTQLLTDAVGRGLSGPGLAHPPR